MFLGACHYLSRNGAGKHGCGMGVGGEITAAASSREETTVSSCFSRAEKGPGLEHEGGQHRALKPLLQEQ